mmetsp:Transcript_82754/g.256862  ORF Transcript_82754/g.256862 Transcript_82754/m.256862 type:complete len:110 (+) Transcript_82754:1616-1945(+)
MGRLHAGWLRHNDAGKGLKIAATPAGAPPRVALTAPRERGSARAAASNAAPCEATTSPRRQGTSRNAVLRRDPCRLAAPGDGFLPTMPRGPRAGYKLAPTGIEACLCQT